MAVDFGQWSGAVAAAGSLLAAVGALTFTWKKRAAWEPSEEDIPRWGQRAAGLVCAICIGALWIRSRTLDTGERSLAMADWALWSLAVALLCGMAYALLVGVYTYERVVVVDEANAAVRKVIGGFRLRAQAREARRSHGHPTIQELFQGAAFDADKIWTRFSRSLAKLLFSLAYMGLVAGGTFSLAMVSLALVHPPQASPAERLSEATQAWLAATRTARQQGTLSSDSPLPTSLAGARADFESAWTNTGLEQRQRLTPDLAYEALNAVIGTYRIQEQNEAVKAHSLSWSKESIRHFEQLQDKPRLVDALLDQAAIMLELAQLENTDRTAFERVSREGDALITRATGLAEPGKRAEVLRVSSRFYYNLARPKSFRLSEAWDNNYLLLAVQKAQEARSLAPQDLRNCNQLLRATMKAARNPPQNSDPAWVDNLRTAQQAMAAAWQTADAGTTRASARLSPLNVLGTGTLELVALEWHHLPSAQRKGRAKDLIEVLERHSLARLREAEALLRNTELRKAFGFDIQYDIARAQAQKVAMLRTTHPALATKTFEEVLASMARARENARTSQLDSALKGLPTDLSFSRLTPSERDRLVKLLQG